MDKKNKQIYIMSPAYFKTGGTELLHQLVFILKKNNLPAEIVYPDGDNKKNINPSFLCYTTSYLLLSQIKDSEDNILIAPEVMTHYFRRFKKIKKYLWWESVDNYLFASSLSFLIKHHNYKTIFKRLFLRKKDKALSTREIRFSVQCNLYQSFYAKDFLRKNNFQNCLYLSDYINLEYIKKSETVDLSAKRDIVCYNPAKGGKFTKKLAAFCKGIRFIPIIGLSNDEVVKIFESSKVYIDFGNHPGKDRLPREAALLGCCIITGRRGAANYYEDIPIPSKYKFKDSKTSFPGIRAQILRCFSNFDETSKDFFNYIAKIKTEFSDFEKDAVNIFKN